MSNPYAPFSEAEVEDYAISLFNQAVLDGKETRPASDTTKKKYRDAAFSMLSVEPRRLRNNGNFIVVGSSPPTRVIEEYNPANYDDYPALDPLK